MSIGTPKRLRELDEKAEKEHRVNYSAFDRSGREVHLSNRHGADERLRGYRDCWEAVKPVIEAAQRVVGGEHGFTYSPTLEQELRDALEGLGLEE